MGMRTCETRWTGCKKRVTRGNEWRGREVRKDKMYRNEMGWEGIEPGWECMRGIQQNKSIRCPGGHHAMRVLECEGVW